MKTECQSTIHCDKRGFHLKLSFLVILDSRPLPKPHKTLSFMALCYSGRDMRMLLLRHLLTAKCRCFHTALFTLKAPSTDWPSHHFLTLKSCPPLKA